MTDVDSGETARPNFAGKWTLDRSDEHFEDFLRENGAPWIARKAAAKLGVTMTIEQEGDKFNIKTATIMNSTLSDFTVGQEFDMNTHGGEVVQGLAKWDGPKLIITLSPKEGGKAKEQSVTREIINNEMVMTVQVASVTCKRYFKRA